MKEKITYERAKRIIENGGDVKCKVSRDVFQAVDSVEKLDALKKLSSVQEFELFYEISSDFTLPKGAIELSINDAFSVISLKNSINCIKNGEILEISSSDELTNVLRSAQIRKENIILYWL